MATEEKNDKNITENFDKVNNYIAPTFNGGSGVGSKSNIEKLAEDYVNSNYTDFTKGSDYASLAKRYNNMGKQAMKDTLGQASARTGGYANSYAVQAGQQAQNSFMEKLEDAARGLYDSQMAEKANKLNVAQGIYDRNYSEFKDNRDFGYSVYRDSVGDSQWKDTMIYNAEQDAIDNQQWQASNVDEEMRTLLGSEGFDWDNYDWDGDGKIGEEDEDGDGLDNFFSGSSYGPDYWNQYWSDRQKEHENGKTQDAQDRVADAWASGVNPEEEDLRAAGYIDDEDNLTPEGQTAKFRITSLNDTALELLINKEGFDWNTYDWDGDGKTGADDTDGENYAGAFINSKLGRDWWEDFYTDTVNGRNYNEVVYMIGNGATMDEIKAEFGIDTEGSTATFETVFGKSEAEIQSLMNKTAEESLVKDMATWDQFNRYDPRIPEGEQDSYYNEWKAGWKDTALSPEATDDAIESGNLSPNVLRSYEIHNGVSYCQKMLKNIMASEPEADNSAPSWLNLFPPSTKEADDGKKKYDMVELYATAWEDYDMYGFYNYIDGLPDDDPLKMIYDLDNSPTPPITNYRSPKMAVK